MSTTIAEARTQVIIAALNVVDTSGRDEVACLREAVKKYRSAVEENIKIEFNSKKEVQMDTYIGVKIVQACPLEQNGQDGFKVVYEDGYVSWSPADVFLRAYRKVAAGEMSFGLAIEALRSGKKVARKGWNGKNMWLVLDPGKNNFTMNPGTTYYNAGIRIVDINPHIDMFTAQGTMQPGWLASHADMLADDWFIVAE